MIKAFRRDNELIYEMDRLLDDSDHFHLWWLGQSGFLLQWNGRRVLLDPYLSDSLTKKYAGTDKPHTRMTERVVDPELLRHISIVTSSHNHTDHLDAETLIPILRNNPEISFIIPEANRSFVAERVKCPVDFPIGLDDGESVTVDEFTFHGIPAKHNEIERDENGHCKYLGYVIQFGQYTIYHSGDTLWFNELAETLIGFKPQVLLLPINGNDPARKVAGNLDVEDAVKLGVALGSTCIIPCHYDMFTFNTADVNDFVAEAEKARQNYCVLKGGERFSN